MFQTRSGRHAVQHRHGQWLVQDPDSPVWHEGFQDPVTGKHPSHPDLDIIPVEPNTKERDILQAIYMAQGFPRADLIAQAPWDCVDQRLILIIRELKRHG